MKRFILLVIIQWVVYHSTAQTWTAIPFSVGGGTGSFTICSGQITVNVTDAFVIANTDGSINLNAGQDITGAMTFSVPIRIKIQDLTSAGSNNGDVWDVTASPVVNWSPFGSEATSAGTNLHLNLTSTSIQSGGITNTATSSLAFSKGFQGGGLFVFFDSNICTSGLPTETIFFNARLAEDNTVHFNWRTASEFNNDYFTVVKSVDGQKWRDIITIEGSGNSTSIKDYFAQEENPFLGLSYYKLKQTDYDGKFTYSEIKGINVNHGAEGKISAYPNPTNGEIKIIGELDELDEISIYNSVGKNMTSVLNIKTLNNGTLLLDISGFETGVYILKTKTQNKLISKI